MKSGNFGPESAGSAAYILASGINSPTGGLGADSPETRGAPAGCGPLFSAEQSQNRPLRQQVFEHIRASGVISRIEIAKDLRISPATVTTLAADLIAHGFLEELTLPRAAEETARGRPPVALGVRPDSGFVIGIKLSDHDYTAVIVDMTGAVRATEEIEIRHRPRGTSEVMGLVRQLVDTVIRAAGLAPTQIEAVGLGIPGFVRAETGEVIWSPLLSERDVALGEALSTALGLTVVIENDANLATLAELWFGQGRTISDFAVVTIEHGVGMGFVTGHRLYSGAHGLGLELGHTKVQLDGALCRCGQRGCLEAYVADYAMTREAVTALDIPPDDARTTPMLIERLYDEAQAGNRRARTIFRRAGRYLSLGLANVANLLDPELIILSGGEMRYKYLYAEETLAEMQNMLLDTGGRGPRIEVNAWGDLLWARGAAALALSHVTGPMLTVRAAAE